MSGGAVVKTLMDSILDVLPKSVPVRLLLPALLAHYASISKTSSTSLCVYLDVVRRMIAAMNNAAIEQHRHHVSRSTSHWFKV